MRSNTTPFLPRALIDQKGQAHCFEQADGLFLLDGMTLTAIEQTDQQMMCLKTATTNVVMTPSALGVAFAGADPTLADIGVLFGTYLHLCIQRHHLTRLLHTFSEEIDTARASLEHAIPLAVPPYHFDAFTERALRRFDGTEGAAHLIADILAQPLDVVRSWATFVQQRSGAQRESEDALTQKQPEAEQTSEDLGTPHTLTASSGVLSPQEIQERACVSLGEAVPKRDTPPAPESTERKWTPETLDHLKEVILTHTTSSLAEAIVAVAPLFKCSSSAIHSQVYLHGINKIFKEHRSEKRQEMSLSPATTQKVFEVQDLPHEMVGDVENEEGREALVHVSSFLPKTAPLENTEFQQDASEEQVPHSNPEDLQQSNDVPEEPSQVSIAEVKQAESDISSDVPSPFITEQRDAFTWDGDTIQQLRTAYMQSQALTSTTTCQEIALQFGWPLRSVTSKVVSLGLWGLKQQQQQQAKLAAQLSLLPKNDLQQGPYGWRIEIGSEITQWYLGYCYGEFPAQYQGQEIRQDGQLYRVERIFSQGIRLVKQASLLADTMVPAQMKVAAS